MSPVSTGSLLHAGIRLRHPAVQVVVQLQSIIQPVILFIDGFFIVFVLLVFIIIEYCVVIVVHILFIRVSLFPVTQ